MKRADVRPVPAVRFTSPRDELDRVLGTLRETLMRHPVAVQAGFAALAAEGRAYARTPRGLEAARRLGQSELVSRLRLIWESLGMTAFSERVDEVLPSFFLDGILRAASEHGLEGLLSKTFDEEL
jgi:hypothetical protein